MLRFLFPRQQDSEITALLVRCVAVFLSTVLFTQCTSDKLSRRADVIVSVHDQKLGLYKDGKLVETFKVSTSKFGLGDKPGSCCTPLGQHEVVAKIGHGLPKGAVLKSRQWSGEVVRPNAPGRDPIVSRILWLSGREASNRNAYGRCIYIHGTAEESRLGVPASYGCVRMAAKDVIEVFDKVGVGASVFITTNDLPKRAGPAGHSSSLKSSQDAPPLPLPKAIPVQVDQHGRVLAKKGGPIGPPSPGKSQA